MNTSKKTAPTDTLTNKLRLLVKKVTSPEITKILEADTEEAKKVVASLSERFECEARVGQTRCHIMKIYDVDCTFPGIYRRVRNGETILVNVDSLTRVAKQVVIILSRTEPSLRLYLEYRQRDQDGIFLVASWSE